MIESHWTSAGERLNGLALSSIDGSGLPLRFCSLGPGRITLPMDDRRVRSKLSGGPRDATETSNDRIHSLIRRAIEEEIVAAISTRGSDEFLRASRMHLLLTHSPTMSGAPPPSDCKQKVERAMNRLVLERLNHTLPFPILLPFRHWNLAESGRKNVAIRIVGQAPLVSNTAEIVSDIESTKTSLVRLWS